MDVVLSDIQMPGTMSGIGLAKWIRAALPAVAVVLMSGGAGAAAEVAMELGPVASFFSKPFDFPKVERCIREQLRAA